MKEFFPEMWESKSCRIAEKRITPGKFSLFSLKLRHGYTEKKFSNTYFLRNKTVIIAN